MSDILLSHQSAFKIRICRAYRLYLKQAKVSVEQWFQRELYFYTIFILTLVHSYQDYFMSTYKHIFFISCGKLALFESSVVHPLMNWCNFTLEYIDFISLWPLWPSFRSNSVCYFSLKYVFCQFHITIIVARQTRFLYHCVIVTYPKLGLRSSSMTNCTNNPSFPFAIAVNKNEASV